MTKPLLLSLPHCLRVCLSYCLLASLPLCTLAQTLPFDENTLTDTPAPAPIKKPMHFSDLQNGFKAWNDGKTDNTFAHGLLILVGLIIVIALATNLWERWKKRGKTESLAALGRDLSHAVPFPFGARLMLYWVAHSTKTPVALLLISRHHFFAAARTWAAMPTFVPLRRWGVGRLQRLADGIFDH